MNNLSGSGSNPELIRMGMDRQEDNFKEMEQKLQEVGSVMERVKLDIAETIT